MHALAVLNLRLKDGASASLSLALSTSLPTLAASASVDSQLRLLNSWRPPTSTWVPTAAPEPGLSPGRKLENHRAFLFSISFLLFLFYLSGNHWPSLPGV